MGFALLKLEKKRRMSLGRSPTGDRGTNPKSKLEAWYQQMRLQHRIIVGPSFFKTSTDPAVPAKAAE